MTEMSGTFLITDSVKNLLSMTLYVDYSYLSVSLQRQHPIPIYEWLFRWVAKKIQENPAVQEFRSMDGFFCLSYLESSFSSSSVDPTEVKVNGQCKEQRRRRRKNAMLLPLLSIIIIVFVVVLVVVVMSLKKRDVLLHAEAPCRRKRWWTDTYGKAEMVQILNTVKSPRLNAKNRKEREEKSAKANDQGPEVPTEKSWMDGDNLCTVSLDMSENVIRSIIIIT